MKLKKTVAELVRDALYFGNLLDGAIFVTDPSVDLGQINGQGCTVDSVFRRGQQLTRALTLL